MFCPSCRMFDSCLDWIAVVTKAVMLMAAEMKMTEVVAAAVLAAAVAALVAVVAVVAAAVAVEQVALAAVVSQLKKAERYPAAVRRQVLLLLAALM